MSKVTNTANLPPAVHLADAVMVGPSKAIELSEANGAREMAAQTEQLPSDGSADPCWAAMGVVFGEVLANDLLFRRVTLPAGWKIERTEHNMWTSLVDDQGVKRAQMFYKAAFYDRRAFIGPV